MKPNSCNNVTINGPYQTRRCCFRLPRTFDLWVVSLLLSLGALAFSINASAGCSFLNIQVENLSTEEPIERTTREHGTFQQESEAGQPRTVGVCLERNSPVESANIFNDGWFERGAISARVALALNAVGTFGVLLPLIGSLCNCFFSYQYLLLGTWYLATATAQSLVFLVFGTEFCSKYICKAGFGAWSAILACFLNLTTATFMFVVHCSMSPCTHKFARTIICSHHKHPFLRLCRAAFFLGLVFGAWPVGFHVSLLIPSILSLVAAILQTSRSSDLELTWELSSLAVVATFQEIGCLTAGMSLVSDYNDQNDRFWTIYNFLGAIYWTLVGTYVAVYSLQLHSDNDDCALDHDEESMKEGILEADKTTSQKLTTQTGPNDTGWKLSRKNKTQKLALQSTNMDADS